ncbi:TetR/AcrR family transcriptional regulator [Hyalangium rubrum]|uniref:Helix-turn-helix domain-containing protein n=1 Tax=Hyalangium rubrum TaxID=3103134 RepID=A0ABU5HGY7_9BACT|nr:helix-turn-helix domain-containing protein [Hyalangium sp. s54d21]MDY7232515.1 helix-turn-helix domain-containing protein [Hyalangium sp. s54d21]
MASKRPARRDKGRRSSSPTEPPPPRRRRTPEEAREEILQAAEPLLVEQGPDRVGLQAVARAAGVSHALVTHYFGTYETLVREVLLRRNQLVVEEFQRRMLEASEPLRAGELLDRFFAILQQVGQTRLLAWALLTGRSEHMPLARAQGLRVLVDALEFHAQRVAPTLGQPPPSRETLEMALLVGICASQWYMLAREGLLPALGKSVDAETDARFREVLAGMLHSTFGLKPRGNGMP